VSAWRSFAATTPVATVLAFFTAAPDDEDQVVAVEVVLAHGATVSALAERFAEVRCYGTPGAFARAAARMWPSLAEKVGELVRPHTEH
jgi:hypothetical protein